MNSFVKCPLILRGRLIGEQSKWKGEVKGVGEGEKEHGERLRRDKMVDSHQRSWRFS